MIYINQGQKAQFNELPIILIEDSIYRLYFTVSMVVVFNDYLFLFFSLKRHSIKFFLRACTHLTENPMVTLRPLALRLGYSHHDKFIIIRIHLLLFNEILMTFLYNLIFPKQVYENIHISKIVS